MLTARGLFAGLPADDPHAHIAKLNHVCKSCIGRSDWDINVIGLRVFPLSLAAMLRCGSINSLQLNLYMGAVDRGIFSKILSSVQEVEQEG
ncbi:hypothetical protein R3W88_014719 [Solanum pinnatisectum]|uniref:Uncharacterized protein n=1 Tax=Solanum pinnatisectum TaxID=50273 RepID=A0AAV9KSG0_9SOLN|nr:hypothetical protein R3W88_014719 [Solanum pinnatisectum]